MTMPPNLIDLSHTVEHGLVTYKGLPAPIIWDYLNREASRKHYAPGAPHMRVFCECVGSSISSR